MENQPDVQIGQIAPDFALDDENEQPVKLGQLRGQHVVLIFYPFDWSWLCTSELCSVRDSFADWASTGACILGISRDSVYSHKAWKEHLSLDYSLLADLRGDVAKAYGAWNEKEYRADRMTVVIDPQGVVSYVVHNDAGHVRDHTEILELVRGMVAGEKC